MKFFLTLGLLIVKVGDRGIADLEAGGLRVDQAGREQSHRQAQSRKNSLEHAERSYS